MATGVCDLGSINLPAYWDSKSSIFDFAKLARDIPIMVRFLDNILDITTYPLKELETASLAFRRIGLGVMGLGSLGFMAGLRYGSPKFLELLEEIYEWITYHSYAASVLLAKEKGQFEHFDYDEYINTDYWKALPLPAATKAALEGGMKKHGLRNSHLTTLAPTGNTGILARLMSGGGEPVFCKEYTRWVTVTDGDIAGLLYDDLKFPDAKKGEWFETDDFKLELRGDEEVLTCRYGSVNYEIDKNRGMTKAESIRDYGWEWVLDNVEIGRMMELNDEGVYAGAEDLSIDEHLSVMEVIYKYLHLGMSKTVNIPASFTFDDFSDFYMKAYDKGIKGLTTYRAGTMTTVMETLSKKEHEELEILYNVKFPETFHARGHLIKSENKKWYVILAFPTSNKEKPIAVFTHTNSTEKTVVTKETLDLLRKVAHKRKFLKPYIKELETKSYHQSNIERICRMLGLLLRHNVSITEITDAVDTAEVPLGSFIFILNKLLKSYIPNGTQTNKICESCGSQMIMQEGCTMCPQCGLSLC